MKQLALRLSDDLHTFVKNRAYDNRRSMNAEMNDIIARHSGGVPQAQFRGPGGNVFGVPVTGFEGGEALINNAGVRVKASDQSNFLGVML